MTAWLTRAETLAAIGARPARLPYVLVPFPVLIALGPGVHLHLLIPLGRN